MQPRPLDISLGGKVSMNCRVSGELRVCPFASHVWLSPVVSCLLRDPDQVPAWWCLDLDSFMLWVEWPTLT